MEYRKRREAKGRPISTRRGEAAPYLASRASGAAIHSNVHVSLSAKIGDGRHISSEARTRPLFADRATGRLRRSRSNMLYFLSCTDERSESKCYTSFMFH